MEKPLDKRFGFAKLLQPTAYLGKGSAPAGVRDQAAKAQRVPLRGLHGSVGSVHT